MDVATWHTACCHMATLVEQKNICTSVSWKVKRWWRWWQWIRLILSTFTNQTMLRFDSFSLLQTIIMYVYGHIVKGSCFRGYLSFLLQTFRLCFLFVSSVTFKNLSKVLVRFLVNLEWYCCNLSGGAALITWFTTNGMCAKNKNICMWR